MDSVFGIGLPELFFIAVLALIILGPERLPGTLREIAKAWGYIRNLGKELTAQFGDEFKALEDLDPRKILNEMADEEMAKDLGLKRPASAQKKSTTSTAAKTPPAKTTPAKSTPAKTTPAKTSTPTAPAKSASTDAKTEPVKAAATKPADDSQQAGPPEASVADPNASASAATVDDEPEKTILPPPPAETRQETLNPASTNGDETASEVLPEKQAIVSAATVNANGASEPAESAE